MLCHKMTLPLRAMPFLKSYKVFGIKTFFQKDFAGIGRALLQGGDFKLFNL